MLTDMVCFMWASAPIMNAIFTVILLLVIRTWSRDIEDSDAAESDAAESKPAVDKIDCKFYFELFFAALLSGWLVRSMW
jgi:hypothetical protein